MYKHKLFSLVAVAALAVCASGCTTLRQEVTCERAEVVARAALDALVARCPAVRLDLLGNPSLSKSRKATADVNAGTANKPVDLNPGAATKLDPPIPHSRT